MAQPQGGLGREDSNVLQLASEVSWSARQLGGAGGGFPCQV
jgi:hypothetical protein